MALAINVYVERYKNFVKQNPLVASELEVALRWISYFAAGRFSHSVILSELMHSVSNILTLVNDSILRKAAKLPVHINSAIENLLTVLSVVEYVEVFAEVGARRIGPRCRWIVIVLLQILKTSIRILLLFKYKQGVYLSPPIPPLNRRADVPQFCPPNSSREKRDPSSANVEFTFTLKRSGRTIRTLEAAPPASGRNWKLPEGRTNTRSRNIPPTLLQGPHLVAEIAYLSRPLMHLTAMRMFGSSSWKPWLLSLTMDAASIHWLRSYKQLNYAERLEISRRVLLLLLYFIRTPFYDKLSRNQIMDMLSSLSRFRVLGILLRPIMDYLPEWQRTYFYTWPL